MPLALPCSSSSSLVSLSVLIQISRVLSSNSSPGPAPEASSHPPPSDLRQISWLHCQASLPGSDGPLLTIMSLQRSPEVPRFPSLSMVPYWCFYNSLCLLHPRHNHGGASPIPGEHRPGAGEPEPWLAQRRPPGTQAKSSHVGRKALSRGCLLRSSRTCLA